MKMRSNLILIMAVIALTIGACATVPFTKTPTGEAISSTATPVPTAIPPDVLSPVEGGPAVIYGTFTYTNDIIEDYYVEDAVALLDLTGFVKRDLEWELPVDSQVLGYLKLDRENNVGNFKLSLPAVPSGVLNDVDNDAKAEQGVQVFVVAFSPNLIGDPFSTGDDRSLGWPSYLASIKADTENNDEVIGGKLIVWAPDENQDFPTGFGSDGLLFTADDPSAPIPAGYSLVDLDQTPFAILRNLTEQVILYEPEDVAVKDFSDLSYTDAFEEMYKFVSTNYAFNDVSGKAPDWETLHESVLKKVKAAESGNDPYKYFLALYEFVNAFKDGHVGLTAGDYFYQYFYAQAGGAYGLAMRELDDGSVIVVYVGEGTPAGQAGIQVGATITKVDGKAVSAAIGEQVPLFGPYSTDFAYRYDQVIFLGRAPEGTTREFTYKNPGAGAEKKASLKAVQEFDSMYATYLYSQVKQNVLPVEYELLESGVGYVRVNSNYDDLNLLIRIFQRALKTFEDNEVPGIIIDMRANLGGAPLGLAGFLYDQEIEMGQLEYYSEKTGKFEPEGLRDKVYPNEEQYRFDKIVLLVDLSCFSACEIESFGFSQVPGVIVMGQYPTAGVEAEVARGQINLPEDFSIQIPTGRFKLPDGSIFLEGKGVQPDNDIPITAETVLSGGDAVLQAAVDEILK